MKVNSKKIIAINVKINSKIFNENIEQHFCNTGESKNFSYGDQIKVTHKRNHMIN
jgi:hypothetical protein